MTYAQMMETIELARHAGGSDITGWVNEQLSEVFTQWLGDLKPGEMTEEEEEALYLAFQEGYGLNSPCPCNR